MSVSVKYKYIFLLIGGFLFSPIAFSLYSFPKEKKQESQLIIIDYDDLIFIKERISIGISEYKEAYQQLINEANGLLNVKPYSVMEKTETPASGDKHDYYSIGTYWWPDSTKENGLPYIRKDGITNPKVSSDAFDKSRRSKTIHAIETLSLAYFYSENESYAKKAVDFIRTWFINPETRMNPNINFGQAIPGINNGRDVGVIDFSILPACLDHIELLKSSKYWQPKDQEKLKNWLSEFLEWFLTSRIALAESRKPNNHGTYYDFQVAYISYYLGKTETTQGILEGAQRRIDWQIKDDGSQPEELIRTRSYEYSIANLRALTLLARIGEKAGIDLWHYQSPQNGSIIKAIDFINNHINKLEQWPGLQIEKIRFSDKLFDILAFAHKVFPDKEYNKIVDSFLKNEIVQNPNFFLLKTAMYKLLSEKQKMSE